MSFDSSLSKEGYLKELKGVSAILKQAEIKDFRLHDSRRTFRNLLAEKGENAFMAGKAFNHKSQSSTVVYARLSADPLREVTDRVFDEDPNRLHCPFLK